MQALRGLSGLSGVVSGGVSSADLWNTETTKWDKAAFNWATAAVPPAFTITSLPNLAAWVNADGTLWQNSNLTTPATADGDRVGAIVPAGGSTGNWLQATAGKRFTLKTNIRNGLPVLRMAPTQTLALASALTGIGDFSLFVAGSLTACSTTDNVLLGTQSDGSFLFDFTATSAFTPQLFKNSIAQPTSSQGSGWTLGSWSLWEMHRSGSTFEFIRDGVSLGANATSSTAFSLQNFNGYDASNFYCTADVGEWNLCTAYLPDTSSPINNRRLTRRYYQSRWSTPQ